jgi:hypothetical protein
MTLEEPPFVSDRWPHLAAEVAVALREAGESHLVDQVNSPRVLQGCGCGDDFCQSFYTQPPPNGAYGPEHRNVGLNPSEPGMLVLDVVNNVIMFVEVIDRPPLG